MLILASTSQTRQTVLRSAGLSFTAERPDVDERALVADHPEWTPAETSVQLAEAKALDVSIRLPAAYVIGADQVLALGDRQFAKPANRADCRTQLRELRGKTHQLISGVVVAQARRVVWSHCDGADLAMRDFSDAFLDDYLDRIGEECTTSVGGYKIEGLGIQLFEAVAGDHFTILGMPLLPLLRFLRQQGEAAA